MARLTNLAGRARAALARVRPDIERRTLVAVLPISALAWAFAKLADAALEGGTHAFDTAVLLALRSAGDPADPLGPGWVEGLMRDVTGTSIGALPRAEASARPDPLQERPPQRRAPPPSPADRTQAG